MFVSSKLSPRKFPQTSMKLVCNQDLVSGANEIDDEVDELETQDRELDFTARIPMQFLMFKWRLVSNTKEDFLSL